MDNLDKKPKKNKTKERQIVENTISGNFNKDSKQVNFQITILTIYYLIMLSFSFWFLFDIWSSKFILMQFLGVAGAELDEPLLRTIGFTIVGGLFGSILYQIRELFNHYAKINDYSSRWFGKFLTAPWEGAGLALVVLSLIRGGVTVFGGSQGSDVTSATNFASFGIGALVGFGMREVVGWLGYLVKTMFTIPPEEKKDPPQKIRKPKK